MPLSQNPFFEKVMQSVQMIANQNAQKQAEERQTQRQVEAEERQYGRQDELLAKQNQQQEFNSLNDWITNYQTNLKAGASPDEEMFTAVNKRRNDLIGSGSVYPAMALPGQTGAPKATKRDFYFTEDIAKHFKIDPNTPVSEETWRILTSKYSTDRGTNNRSGANNGGGTNNPRDPLTFANKLIEGAENYYYKGKMDAETEADVPLNDQAYQTYMNSLIALRQKILTGKATQEDIATLYSTPTLTVWYAKYADALGDDGKIDQIIKMLGEDN